MAKTQEERSEEDKRADQASRSAKVFCLVLLFAVIYGKMLLSTVGANSGFNQLKSANITNVTIYGDLDIGYFEKNIAQEAREITQRIFQQDSLRIYNTT